jgi:hypothetical protein
MPGNFRTAGHDQNSKNEGKEKKPRTPKYRIECEVSKSGEVNVIHIGDSRIRSQLDDLESAIPKRLTVDVSIEKSTLKKVQLLVGNPFFPLHASVSK